VEARGLRSGGDREPVPGVDHRDRDEQVGELVGPELRLGLGPRLVGDVGRGDVRDRLGQRQRSPLALVEVGALRPRVELREPLLGLAVAAAQCMSMQ
jgi:hypothetical protein